MDCRVFFKVIVAALVFISMLVCLVTNKVSLIWLLGSSRINNLSLEIWYGTFALVLIIPEILALIKVLWNTSFIKKTKTHQWPSGIALFVGFLVSFAEVVSFMMFTLEVAPRLPVQLLLPVLSSVFAVGLCYEQWDLYRVQAAAKKQASEVEYDTNFTLTKPEEMKHTGVEEQEELPHEANWRRVVKTLIGFSGVWATCVIAGITALTSALPWFQALCLPTCLLLLSLAWCPKVQVYIVKSHEDTFLGRWKATALYTVFKIIILVVGLSVIMVIRMRESGVLDTTFFLKMLEGIRSCDRPEIFYPLFIHFSSSLMVHIFSFVATTLCMPTLGLTLPHIFATPIAIAIGMLICGSGGGYLEPGMCITNGIWVWSCFGLAVVPWIAPILIKGPKKLNLNANILLKPMEELFIQASFNSIFMDQHMILNYKHDGFTCKAHVTDPSKAEKSRVFICTTMYREAEFEMSRLLASLHRVAQSDKLKNVYLEAHIFLDNGVKDGHITDFATQLMSLLSSKMEVSLKDGYELQTPYGLQLNWIIPGGMPFFIHLKDSGKVKPKKRWSQVMYMSYVLNYRVLRDHSKDKFIDILNYHASADESLYVGYASDREWKHNTASLSKDGKVAQKPVKNKQDEKLPPIPPQTPYYLRENKKRLRNIIDSNPNLKDIDKGEQGFISSDQGFMTGIDDVESESSEDSLENPSPPRSSKGHDDSWPDYEGDTSSSCNEFDGVSSYRRKTRSLSRVVEEGSNLYEYPPQTDGCSVYRMSPKSLGGRRLDFGAHGFRSPERPPRLKKYSSKRQRSNRPRNIEHTNSTAKLVSQDSVVELGHDNAAFDDSEDTDLELETPGIFTISRKTVPSMKTPNFSRIPLDDHTYILATDADMEFNEDSLLNLLKLCNHDRRLGGACGRTHPIGQSSGPLVWYQKFEYAKDFWMIKSAQNIVGSVMCCPGCFSLYRASAVRDVVAHYAGPTDQPFDVFIKDTGEDRWMCTLMMLRGWKLEYNAFCDNTTYCPDSFEEFMKQRRRWVLSDMANMLLVFRNIFKLAQKNDSFSLAYIFYMVQMFIIVLLSPASTIVILAGGLDIVYGIPFEIIGPVLGCLTLLYSLVCIVGSDKLQSRLSLFLTVVMGLTMLSIVIGGSVYVIQDISKDVTGGTVEFQEYYLILILIASLIYAALIHPKETYLIIHALAYLLGFPAMQVLLPIYAICNIVDQSWGTRDTNQSKETKVSCFSKNRKKYHKRLSRKSTKKSEHNVNNADENEIEIDTEDTVIEDDDAEVECSADIFKPMAEGNDQQVEEYIFWERMREIVLGREVNLGLEAEPLAIGLRNLRNICLLSLLILNALWLILLSVLYFNANFNLVKLNVYGLIAGAVYGAVLAVQVIGMTAHRLEAVFTRYSMMIFGPDRPVWIMKRTAK